ncbi:DNA-directed RNA polymerase subunit omega [Leptolyngbya sp. 7M]|uniref:DNA-directed RNA polymerase subunit omega n=1 Tax=Leptolyngbya sp. 7M TaxID=2812896 RepID=UPI001B8B0843|nr:DNA-directed RNA polymerase subunit omega [Leptolyngbya sp. 7M]QYO67415.1 DNA-directed RNA polymerase subunit omega [Leptolyngbya sp. 7M]
MMSDDVILQDEEELETPIEEIDPPEIDSKYRLILLAAQRSKQLQRGALPRIDADTRKQKPTRIALKEVEMGKVNFRFLDQSENGDTPPEVAAE